MRRRRRLFRLCSETFIAVYGRAPLLGRLRCAVAVVQRGDQYLWQRRADERGIGLPGGTAWFWEGPEATMRREVAEETGTEVVSSRFLFRFFESAPIPVSIHVYAAEVRGEARGSWEGEAEWMTLAQVQCEIFFPPHLPVLRYLLTGAMPPERLVQ